LRLEDIRRYKEAVALARSAHLPIALATLRIIKPTEEGCSARSPTTNPTRFSSAIWRP